MPELPDVQYFKQYLDATSLHRPVKEVVLYTAQVLANITIDELETEVAGRTFAGSDRHGKYLLVELDDGRTLIMHFGMTGHLEYFEDAGGEPEFTDVRFQFEDDGYLAYVAPRKLGGLRLVEDVSHFLAAKDLGPDVLDDEFDFETFRDLLSGRRGMIKSALMDQSLMAGIGNIYADEILFQSRLHPRAPVQTLDEETLHTLYMTMEEVLQTAIEHNANPEQFPDSFIIPQRHEDGHCPQCGGAVQTVDVAGRTAYYCPQCQAMPDESQND